MKKWKFSLESVRTLKERLQQEATQKHATALLQVNAAKAALVETEKEINAAAFVMYSDKGRSTAREISQIAQYVSQLEKRRKERLELLIRAEKEVTLAHAQLEKVAREKEILDRLHDRRKSEHQFHMAQQEQKWIDELALRVKSGLLRAV